MILNYERMETRILEDLSTFSSDISRLEEDEGSADTVFVTGPEEARHNGHRTIFSVRCQHFHRILANHHGLQINLPNVSSSVFSSFKHYVYSGRLVVDHLNIFELMRLADQFGLGSLLSLCSDFVGSALSLSSAVELLNQCVDSSAVDGEASNHQSFQQIARFIKDNLTQLRDRKLIKSMQKAAIIRLIKSRVLEIDENEVWRMSLDWARLQAGIEDNLSPKLWTDEQRTEVRSILDGVVQCIRVLHIDSAVFAEEVEPTGAIPMELSLERYRHAAALPEKYEAKKKNGGGGEAYTMSDLTAPPGGVTSSSRVECARALPAKEARSRLSSRVADELSRLNPRVESDPRPYQRSSMPPYLQAPGHPTAVNSSLQSVKLIHGSAILSSLGSETSLTHGYYEKILNSWTATPNQAWTVIFRGSDHAFSAQAFHRLCDGASPSYVLVKADTGIYI